MNVEEMKRTENYRPAEKYRPVLAKQFDAEAEIAFEEYYELPDLYYEKIKELNAERFKAMAELRRLIHEGHELYELADKKDKVKILVQNLEFAIELMTLDKQCECSPWNRFIH